MTPSDEVSAATGAGPDLDERIATLESELAVPTPRETKTRELTDLQRRKADRDAVALRGEAKARLFDIQRALGSLADQSAKDNSRLLDAARKFADQVVGLSDRYEKCLALRHEAATLAEVFGFPIPDLPTVIVPALRPDVQQAFEVTSSVGVRDNGFVRTTTDTEGHRTFEESELGEVARALLRRNNGQG